MEIPIRRDSYEKGHRDASFHFVPFGMTGERREKSGCEAGAAAKPPECRWLGLLITAAIKKSHVENGIFLNCAFL
jgi:hypothetical protein